jgi:hypothetical protein
LTGRAWLGTPRTQTFEPPKSERFTFQLREHHATFIWMPVKTAGVTPLDEQSTAQGALLWLTAMEALGAALSN